MIDPDIIQDSDVDVDTVYTLNCKSTWCSKFSQQAIRFVLTSAAWSNDHGDWIFSVKQFAIQCRQAGHWLQWQYSASLEATVYSISPPALWQSLCIWAGGLELDYITHQRNALFSSTMCYSHTCCKCLHMHVCHLVNSALRARGSRWSYSHPWTGVNKTCDPISALINWFSEGSVCN